MPPATSARAEDSPATLSDEDRAKITAWNTTTADPFDSAMIHERFEQQAEQAPDQVAAIFGGETLTYAELNRRANQLAEALRSEGVTVETRVGVCLQRSFEMLVAILGVLKAGGGYVPLDPALPSERIEAMVTDAELGVIVTQERFRSTLATHGAKLLALDSAWPQIAAHTDTNPAPTPFVDSAVYVTFTSGSTGRPKGVLMTQRPLLNLLGWMFRHHPLAPGAHTLQFASLSFDVSFQDIFSTLLSGGTVVLITEDQRHDLRGLVALVDRFGIHRIFLPTVALQQLAVGFGAGRFPCAHLRQVVSAGEALVITEAIRAMFATLPDCRLRNEYGPSESHVVTALTLPTSAAEWPARPAIGQPIANTQIHILDAELQPVPIGELGELYIGGLSLARGYVAQPALTAEKFIADPFSKRTDARLYRTGDQARWLPSGDIEFVGRLDHQIKIRGYRVEAGEIETAIEQHPAIRETCVITQDTPGSGKRLVAYLVAQFGTAPTIGDLRAHLATTLPDYMIPSAFVFLEALPLNINGKIDRAALPLPPTSRPELATAFAAPANEREATIAAIWREVLHLDRIGVRDNFFDLGGDSIMIVQVHQRLESELQFEIAITTLFERPTISALAEFLADDGTRAAQRQQTTAERAAKQRAALARPPVRR